MTTTHNNKRDRNERPRATSSNRALFVAHCAYLQGLSVRESDAEFERENRKLWASALA